MAGINQGVPETAIGEPIRLGSNSEFEIEQHPVSDRLIIRDTLNGKVAYVRKERGGQIGGDGVLIKSLKEGKPMADDGRTYDTIQQAERAANGWVFVPPGTFNESVTIDTDGLTLRGSGYNTLINASGDGVVVNAKNCTIDSVRVTSGDRAFLNPNGGGGTYINCVANADNRTFRMNLSSPVTVINCVVEDVRSIVGINVGSGSIVTGSIVKQASGITAPHGISADDNTIITNNIIQNANKYGIFQNNANSVIAGNRIINSGDTGLELTGDSSENIIANNRISDSANADINNDGTGNLLDGNLTGASN